MGRALIFGLAAGAGLQAWRHWPADGPLTANGVYLLFLVGLLTAYLSGRWHGRGRPAFVQAVAEARATAISGAQSNVNVAVVVPGSGAGSQVGMVGGARVPDQSVSWLGSSRVELTENDFDGMDVQEFMERESEW